MKLKLKKTNLINLSNDVDMIPLNQTHAIGGAGIDDTKVDIPPSLTCTVCSADIGPVDGTSFDTYEP